MAAGPTVVTGASGFVGRHLLAALRPQRREPIIGWRNRRAGHDSSTHWRQVDILDPDAVCRAIAEDKPAQIFHLAGAPHVGDSWRNSLPTLQINVLGTQHLLDAVRRAHPACRVLIVTSGMIYKPGPDALTEDGPLVPSNPYGLSKLAQDQLGRIVARQDGLDVVVARPFNHIGPGQDPTFAVSSFARQIALIEAGATPPELQVGNLDAERDLTDVRDVANAYVRIMDDARTGDVFNVCSGQTSRIGDLLSTLLGLTATPIAVRTDPDRMRPSDIPRLLGSHDRLTAMSGWSPAIPLAQTLADTLDWWRAAVADGRAGR